MQLAMRWYLMCITGSQTSTHMCQQLPIIPLAISQGKLITCNALLHVPHLFISISMLDAGLEDTHTL